MKKLLTILLCAGLLLAGAWAEKNETVILLGDDQITVNGEAISEDEAAAVYLDYRVEVHEDVPEELEGLENRVITITDGGAYRFSGTAADAQIAVRAGEDDAVRIILDGVNISCRTAPAIAVYTAQDPRVPGEYGVTIEVAQGSENSVTGSHTEEVEEDDIKLSGAISSLVSIGFEGQGSLNVDADNEGIETKFGHMTFNGGSYRIQAGDDPLNVSEDGVGTLTVNDGYLYSSVKPEQGGEGDGVDSNGYIVFNGGTIINLAHPTSGDSGIDSDMGSSINGGVVVGAGNMYDPIDEGSSQLFMMLEFSEQTDDLLVVTDANDVPVFAYDFPYSYTYIAFSSPELAEGEYHVYLGGEIVGEQVDGLYTSIESYTPGTPLQHGAGTAQQGDMLFGGGMEMDRMMNYALLDKVDLNEILADVDLNQLLEGKDLNGLLTGFAAEDILSEDQIAQYMGDMQAPDFAMPEMTPPDGMGRGMDGGMGGPRGMESSGDAASTSFMLSAESTGFTNVSAAE